MTENGKDVSLKKNSLKLKIDSRAQSSNKTTSNAYTNVESNSIIHSKIIQSKSNSETLDKNEEKVDASRIDDNKKIVAEKATKEASKNANVNEDAKLKDAKDTKVDAAVEKKDDASQKQQASAANAARELEARVNDNESAVKSANGVGAALQSRATTTSSANNVDDAASSTNLEDIAQNAPSSQPVGGVEYRVPGQSVSGVRSLYQNPGEQNRPTEIYRPIEQTAQYASRPGLHPTEPSAEQLVSQYERSQLERDVGKTAADKVIDEHERRKFANKDTADLYSTNRRRVI